MELLIYIAFFILITITYLRSDYNNRKEIEFWRNCYFQEKESSDVLIKYAITAAYNDFIDKEDYESARRAMEILKSLNQPTNNNTATESNG
jgi:hypothetical protein